MDIREAANEFYAAKRTKVTYKTLQGYEIYLEGFVKWCEGKKLRLEELRSSHIREFIAFQQNRKQDRKGNQGKPLADWSINHYAAVVRTFLKWCHKDEDFGDYVPKRLGDNIEMPKARDTVIETFTPQEIQVLFKAAANQSFESLRTRDKALLSLLLDTGIRASETVLDANRPAHNEPTGLRVDNIHLDPEDSYIKVFGKGRKEREMPLGNEARRALRSYLRVRNPADGACTYLFLNRAGHPLTVNGLDQLLKRLGEMAGVNEVHAHKFRHTFAVNYLLAGGDLYLLSRLMGHTTTTMTQKYLRAMTQRQARKQGISVLEVMR